MEAFRRQQQVLVPVARYTSQGLLVWTLGGGGGGKGCLSGSNHRLINCGEIPICA